MATKPTNLAEWATAGGAAVTEPTLPEKQTGWVVDTKPPAQWFNWWQKLVHQWVVWLDAFESEAHTWSATQTFATIVVTTINSVSLALSGTLAVTGMATLSGGLTLSRSGATDPQILASAVATSRRLLFRQQIASAPDNFVRVYVSSHGLEATVNAVWNGSQWDFDDNLNTAYRARVGSGAGFRVERSDSGPWADNAWVPMFKLFTAAAVGDVLTVTSGQAFELSNQITQPAWASTLTPNAGLVTVSVTPQIYKDTLGRVWARGRVDASTTIANGNTIATLPVGSRPDQAFYWMPEDFGDSAGDIDRTDFRLFVQTDGTITLALQTGAPTFAASSWFSFNGLNFRAA